MSDQLIKEFERIKAAVLAGANINAPQNGCHMVYDYLDSYYQSLFPLISDDDCEGEEFPDELLQPLAKRPTPILQHMEWFFEHGANLNIDEENTPLMLAVAYHDASMTDYLLKHGADPECYPREEGLYTSAQERNYYFEDLDIAAIDESFVTNPDKKLFDRIMAVAKILARHGVRGSGMCLTIDETTVELHRAKTKF